MQYEVIRYFTDAQDNEYAYREGDIYPREGYTVSDARIKDLLSGNNFQRVPLIKRVTNTSVKKEKKIEEPKEYTAEDIMKMPYMKLKSLAKQNDVDVKDREAVDIRNDLIAKLGL